MTKQNPLMRFASELTETNLHLLIEFAGSQRQAGEICHNSTPCTPEDVLIPRLVSQSHLVTIASVACVEASPMNHVSSGSFIRENNVSNMFLHNATRPGRAGVPTPRRDHEPSRADAKSLNMK